MLTRVIFNHDYRSTAVVENIIDTMNKKIWKGGTTHCCLGQSTQVPGNKNRFVNIRKCGYPNG